MEQLRQAYQQLGLPEDATIEQVEHRYFLWLRKEKSHATKGTSQAVEPAQAVDFAAITAAYQHIKNHVHQQTVDRIDPLQKIKSVNRQKFEHFWEYYKLHTFGVIFGIMILGFIIQGIVQSQQAKAYEASLPPVDVSISLFGAYWMDEMDQSFLPMEQALMDVMDSWQRVKINLVYAPLEAKDSFDMAYQQKSLIALATERPDVYISDDGNFSRLAMQGLFYPLSEIEAEIRAVVSEDRLFYSQTEEFPERTLYGIDISDSSIFQGLAISKQPKIIGIRINAAHLDQSLLLIQQLLKETK